MIIKIQIRSSLIKISGPRHILESRKFEFQEDDTCMYCILYTILSGVDLSGVASVSEDDQVETQVLGFKH